MSEALLEAFVERGVQLKLMGFGKAELKSILRDELSHAPTDEEWDDVFKGMQTALREFTLDTSETNEDLNLYLARSEWIQGQLLAVFNSMLRNYNAYSEGKMEHDPDPVTGESEPVLPVKPSDISTMGKEILKLDEDRLAAKLSYPQSLQKAQQALAAGEAEQLTSGGHAALSALLYDTPGEEDITDADFEEAQ